MYHHISEYQVEDLDELALVFDEYRAHYGQACTGDTREFLRSLMASPGYKIFIGRNRETRKLEGFLTLYPSFSSLALKPIFILNDLAVTPSARGMGLGEALIDTAVSFAEASDAVRLELKTDVGNRRARSLYRRVGFDVDESHVYYRVPL